MPGRLFRCLAVLWMASQATACVSPAAETPGRDATRNALAELADPLGPAGLYANSFTLASSWDPAR